MTARTHPQRLHLLAAAITALLAPLASADEAVATLPAVRVDAAGDVGFTARKASSSTLKSDLPLNETAQSVAVVTREQMDARGVQSLTDALQGVAGVVSGYYGRRGWDDFIIRGQRATESVYVDGLRVEMDARVAQETFGAERIEVLKGPASVNFGLVQPGGMVNMVSKRPRAEAFTEVAFTGGSDNFRQFTFDFGRPLSDTGRSALRINGLMLNSDDPTDFVYYKNRWIAPSMSLDLGTRTDFTILTSFQTREYVRQQGLPVRGSVLPNPNGRVDRSLFIGEPGFGPYEASQARIGYALEHRFDSGWTLRQNFRWQDYDMDGRLVAVDNGASGGLQANNRQLKRQGTLQDFRGHGFGLDTHVSRAFDTGSIRHTLLAGVDVNRHAKRETTTRCAVGMLDVFTPVYGSTVSCNVTPLTDLDETIRYTGFYLRDQVRLTDRLNASVTLRRDWASIESVNMRTGASITDENYATTTGSAGLIYEVIDGVSPYVSYAESFLPQGGYAASGEAVKPESGKQTEVGVKFSFAQGRIQATVAHFDLERQDVRASDASNPGFYILIGEQRTRGYELELLADLRNGWNLSAAYANTDGEVVRDVIAANVGKPLDNVPRHSASLWAQYRVRSGALTGLGLGAGLRYESEKQGYSFAYTIPDYTVFDASVSYIGQGYRLSVIAKNLFDRDYFAGGLNNNVIPLGDPRRVLASVTLDF